MEESMHLVFVEVLFHACAGLSAELYPQIKGCAEYFLFNFSWGCVTASTGLPIQRCMCAECFLFPYSSSFHGRCCHCSWLAAISKDIFIKRQWYGHYLHYTYRDLYLPCWLCLFAMHPGGFREGTGSVTGCGRHHPQHSPACTDVFRTNVYRRDSSASQWEAVVEVSLFSYSIFARLLAIIGSAGCVNRSGMHHRCAAPFFAPLCDRLYL